MLKQLLVSFGQHRKLFLSKSHILLIMLIKGPNLVKFIENSPFYLENPPPLWPALEVIKNSACDGLRFRFSRALHEGNVFPSPLVSPIIRYNEHPLVRITPLINLYDYFCVTSLSWSLSPKYQGHRHIPYI